MRQYWIIEEAKIKPECLGCIGYEVKQENILLFKSINKESTLDALRCICFYGPTTKKKRKISQVEACLLML